MSTPNPTSYRIARRAGYKGPRPPVTNQAGIEKYATGWNHDCLIKAKRENLITSFNARTLRLDKNKSELTATANAIGIEVVCIQEHRIYHDDVPTKQHNMGKGWKLITGSATKNDSNATVGGVGMLLSPNACKSLINIETINPRLMIATFNGNPQTTIISCYSPTNASEPNAAEEFYSDLANLIKEVPKHNVILVGGDMNAQIGKDDCKGTYYHDTTNRNGHLLLELMSECGMVNLMTKYQKRRGKIWTFTYPNGTKAQLDHILINKKWRNSALNCEAYNTFLSIGSDHRPITAKIRLSLRANVIKKTKKIQYDWSQLLTDDNIKTAYSVEVTNHYNALQDLTDDNTSNTQYNNIIEAHSRAAETHVPVKPRKKRRVPWEDQNITEKREELKRFHAYMVKNPTIENEAKAEEMKKELDDAYLKEQEEYVKEKISIIQNAHINQQSRLAWATVNEVSGRKKTASGQIKAKSAEERVKLWKEHFQKLLGQPPDIDDKPTEKVFDTLPMETGNFTYLELRTAIKSLQNNKATGLDGIPAEVWKVGCLDQQLLEVCNKTYHGEAPNIWLKGGILPFPKKGDLGITTNYRGITLSAVAAKIYNKMLLNRLKPHIDPILRKNQNGFRSNRSTTAQILALRRVIEGIKEKNLPAVITFVDFRKAFDSIHRGKLMKILIAYGVPEPVVSAIEVLYTNTIAKVLSPDGDTEEFEILAGVLQGDTLAPFLFTIALDYALRIATKNERTMGFTLQKAKSRRHPSKVLCDTDFADDIALLSNVLEEAQLFLLRVEIAVAQIGLHINEDKTEYMMYNQPDGQLVTLNGGDLKQVKDFQYLGSRISSCETDINIRIGKAWAALSKMNVIWKSNMNRQLKISLFRSTVETVLMYGSSTWTLTKTLKQKIDGVYTRMLRSILNINWKSHTTNKELYGDLPRVSQTIQERRLQFSGHCMRSKSEVISDVLLWEPSHGKRSRGRPAKTYIDQLVEDTGLEREDLQKAMEDRTTWKGVIRSVRPRSIR